MAALNQDFITFKGDTVSPVFTVVASDGVTAVDISQVSDIQWSAQRNLNDAIALSKSKLGGQIAFVTNGTDGKFQVNLVGADTSALAGWYVHTAKIVDSSGNLTTVTIGQMNVGPTPDWTYDDGSSAAEDIYDVRELIGDTAPGDQQLSDQSIFNVLGRYSNNYMAAADCAKRISAKYARQVDVVQGEMKTNYSMRAKAYMTLSRSLLTDGIVRGGATGYMGGISISDKMDAVSDTDRVPPNFLIAMFDNMLPTSPVGQQANANLNVPINDGQLNASP